MLGIPEVIVPPHPGITSAVGLLTTDLQLRRDPHLVPGLGRGRPRRASTRDFAAMASGARRALHRRRHRPREGHLRAPRRSALRRPGLRAARADPRRADRRRRCWPRRSRPSTRSIAAEYGHHFADSPASRSSTCAWSAPRALPRSPSRPSARPSRSTRRGSRQGTCMFRVDGKLADYRDRLLSPRPAAGRRAHRRPRHHPADGLARPSCRPAARCRGRCGGQSPDHARRHAMSSRRHSAHPRRGADRIDPITAAVIQGALENIAVEMGYKLMRMSYSIIIRESEDFGAALVDAEGRGLAESAQITPLQSGPIPGYVRGILRQLAERGDADPAGRRDHAQRRLCRRQPRPRRRLHACRCSSGGELIGFSATTAHHLDIGALTPGSLRHRRRDRCLRRGPAVQGDQGLRPRREERRGLADRARQHPRAPTSWSATWRRRSPPRASAPSAWSSWSSATAWRPSTSPART